MRNVLEELQKIHHGQRTPTILGLREHIFTGRLACIFGTKVCLNLNMYSIIDCYILTLALPNLQCFFTCLVHVQSGNKFCDYWTANFG